VPGYERTSAVLSNFRLSVAYLVRPHRDVDQVKSRGPYFSIPRLCHYPFFHLYTLLPSSKESSAPAEPGWRMYASVRELVCLVTVQDDSVTKAMFSIVPLEHLTGASVFPSHVHWTRCLTKASFPAVMRTGGKLRTNGRKSFGGINRYTSFASAAPIHIQ
jgi:hypothetical protein